LRSIYPPQHSALKNPQSMFLPQSERPSFAPIQYTGKFTVLYILIFSFLIWDGKTKDFGLNDSKHSLNLIFFWFHHECHSDLLVLSPSIWILPHFQTIH
jgi:hypothetical protein